jgi:glucokinase
VRVGVDLGGTRIKAGLVDERGEVIARCTALTGEPRAAVDVARRIAAAIDPMLPKAASVGLAAAGVFDRARGVIRESPNFPAWRDVALGELLAAEIGRPVTLDNDANAVIWGETCHGAGKGARNLIGYTLGTGVGGAVVLSGQLWRGGRGMAGELGHAVVVRDGHACGCGGRGCLEQYVGAVGLRRRLGELGYADLSSGVDAPRLAAERARAGDPTLVTLFREVGEHLGVAIASMLHALDVERVVLSGGLAGASDLFLGSAQESMRAHAFASMAEGVDIVVGTLGEEAGIVGAAALN